MVNKPDKVLKIFVHVMLHGAWREICVSMLNLLKKSGLFYKAQIHYFIAPTSNDGSRQVEDALMYRPWLEYCKQYNNIQIFYLHDTVIEDFEIPSIRNLKILTGMDKNESYVLYLHLKGVTKDRPNQIFNQIDWRNFMFWGCIENWETCLERLDQGYDTVGVNLVTYPGTAYNGNIWWATSHHISKLPLLKYPHKVNYKKQIEIEAHKEGKDLDRFTSHRLDAEFWVCSIPSRNYELASATGDHGLYQAAWHYWNTFPIENYNRPENESENVLFNYFTQNDHRLIHKYVHYFEIYERHLRKFRNKPVSLLVFGVAHGGTLQMWKHYFGNQAKIYGVDCDPRCSGLGEQGITIIQGSQENRIFLRGIKNYFSKFDIIIDDGWHTLSHQTTAFEEMFPHLNDGGIYLAEGLHNCYSHNHDNTYDKPNSFIEYSKRLVDQLHAWHSQDERLTINDFTRTIFSTHYYDGILVIEKRIINPPYDAMKGTPSFPLNPAEKSVYEKNTLTH